MTIHSMLHAVACWVIYLCATQVAASAAPIAFTFALDQPGLTSAGVYDAQDRLVRTLWQMKTLNAGTQTAAWDGVDDLGQPVAPGSYQFRVVLNGGVYKNVGAIGQNGATPDVLGHVPLSTYGIAIDNQGSIYTANSWNEAGDDVKKWDKTGKALWTFNYKLRNGTPPGLPMTIAVDDRYFYAYFRTSNHPQRTMDLIGRFDCGTGNAAPFPKDNPATSEFGHILVNDFPDGKLPAGIPLADEEAVKFPLRALAVSGAQLWVADARNNRLRSYDKTTGAPLREIPVPLPLALAIDVTGQLYVGHEHRLVSLYSVQGAFLRDVLTDLKDVTALSFGPQGDLYVADAGDGVIKVCQLQQGGPAVVTRTLGSKRLWGDRPAGAFHTLRSMAVDTEGNVVTVDRGAIACCSLAKWNPDGKCLWEKFSNEWMDTGNYGQHHPDRFVTHCFNAYKLLDRQNGGWEFLGHTFQGPADYHTDCKGVVRVLRLGSNDFVFLPQGDGVQVYRGDGPFWHLAALLGGKEPKADAVIDYTGNTAEEWSWHDATGSGQPKPEEINLFKPRAQTNYKTFGTEIDPHGNIWYANLHAHAIWTLPMDKLDARGNPTYDWSQAHLAVPHDDSALGFDPSAVRVGDDGAIYSFGWSKQWPQPQPNDAWMGGTTLVKFSAKGEKLWAIKLPMVCVGMDVIPGAGGVMVGTFKDATIYHISPDGLLLNAMKPGQAMAGLTGALDNPAAVAVNRDPRDHLIDVFVEDDLLLRIGWYRVDDAKIKVVSGELHVPN